MRTQDLRRISGQYVVFLDSQRKQSYSSIATKLDCASVWSYCKCQSGCFFILSLYPPTSTLMLLLCFLPCQTHCAHPDANSELTNELKAWSSRPEECCFLLFAIQFWNAPIWMQCYCCSSVASQVMRSICLKPINCILPPNLDDFPLKPMGAQGPMQNSIDGFYHSWSFFSRFNMCNYLDGYLIGSKT